MTQGELEQIPQPFVELMSDLEMRIMKDIIERIKANGFSPASADWEISRLQQLGESEEQIRKWIKETLEKTDDEVDKIFSDDVYREYYGHDREYQVSGFEQIPLEQNVQLLQVIEASKRQTKDTFKNLTGSTGFAIRDPATGNIMYSPTMKFYQQTLDAAIMDIKSGAFSYNTVLQRTINTMTTSGLRWIDYDSGWHNRVDVAARRAVMTGFRQVQGKINEQVAEQLQTDTYEVTYHVGARPTHQPWQGRVWTMQQLIDVCGLGTVAGLHGANCYHDYKPFIPGVSVRTYTDEQLDQMIAEENTPKEYLGKKYTTYEALQAQRRMETRMRKTRQDIRLMQDGGADPQDIVLKKAKYQGQMQTYKAFSEAMELPEQMERVYQDGLRGKFTPTKSEKIRTEEKTQAKETIRERRAHNTQFAQRFEDYNLDAKDTITTRKLMNNLNRTEIGRSTVEYLVEHPEIKVYMCYGVDHESGTRGYQEKNDIMIFASETKTVQVTAETLIHEITHHKYNIGESQWAESVCFAQELKHRMGKSQLTVSELRNIIKTVKELYPELPWRYKSES
jgi:hypothetical protein|uniref:Minor capsid protein n=1 Tax=Siphoviridae sp. ct9Y44 TaxID=2826176 RepID=A0A8S5LYW9_9CAUD|nr:MAG TPA: minor capsid protein [Siphoviridae sp. ct9Y44]